MEEGVKNIYSWLFFVGFRSFAWEQRRLGDVVKMVGGATPSKANKAYWNGDIVWLSSQEIKDRYVSAGTYTITEKAVRESATKVVPAFTPLIVSRSGILARMFPITLPTVDVAINQDIKALLLDSGILDTYFFVSQLEMKENTILTSIVKTGTTVQSVNMPDFEKLIISIPSIREQQKIGKTFKNLDNLITLHQREP
ncbi:restriction endonuclease subunit S [Paenibacillus pinistramenti]|uniref:restriction endonuclease subunit S n=1 Tax=Paenibacillus pinistramenti TaxID=1768003 RepID=UPI001109E742|nr:restriction endonuclease subunit S [Paenibacillus pinistramenti]